MHWWNTWWGPRFILRIASLLDRNTKGLRSFAVCIWWSSLSTMFGCQWQPDLKISLHQLHQSSNSKGSFFPYKRTDCGTFFMNSQMFKQDGQSIKFHAGLPWIASSGIPSSICLHTLGMTRINTRQTKVQKSHSYSAEVLFRVNIWTNSLYANSFHP